MFVPRRIATRLIRPAASAVLLAAILALPARAEWQTFTTADGLVSNDGFTMFEDPGETLWLVAGSGISRYDGDSWQTLPSPDSTSTLVSGAIGPDGAPWVASLMCVARYDGGVWRKYTTPDSVRSLASGFLVAHDGRVWCASPRGVMCLDGGTWRRFGQADRLPESSVWSLCEDHEGRIWAGTMHGGVAVYQDGSWTTISPAVWVGGAIITGICEDSAGRMWFARYGDGIRSYDPVRRTWGYYDLSDGLPGLNMTCVGKDGSGNLWFGTEEYGVVCFNGDEWQCLPTSNAPALQGVSAIRCDRAGNLWFVSWYQGVSRFDRSGCTSYPQTVVSAQDSAGRLWAVAGVDEVKRFDGRAWQTFTRDSTGGVLSGSSINSIFVDHADRVWFGTFNGLACYEQGIWRKYTHSNTADSASRGLPSDHVDCITEDRSGRLWLGGGALSSFDGVSWRTYTQEDGVPDTVVTCMARDSAGGIWVGTANGAARYDGTRWTSLRWDVPGGCYRAGEVTSITADPKGNVWFTVRVCPAGVRLDRLIVTSWERTPVTSGPSSALTWVYATSADSTGRIWLATIAGLCVYVPERDEWRIPSAAQGVPYRAYGFSHVYLDRSERVWVNDLCYEPDRVPPQTFLSPKPPRVVGVNAVTVPFRVAFGESYAITYSCSLNGEPFGPWSEKSFWLGTSLRDSVYVLAVRARDWLGNIDTTAARDTFEVDATPPTPVIKSPAYGSAVRDTMTVEGTAADPRFVSFRLEIRPASTASWDASPGTVLHQSTVPVTEGALGRLNTKSLEDGVYELRLSVTDELGLTGRTIVRVVVDNKEPFVDETAPVRLRAADGGDVYTTRGDAHLYFAPHAFDQDAIVSLTEPDSAAGSFAPPPGARLVRLGFWIGWREGRLQKNGILDLSYAGVSSDLAEAAPVMYVLVAGGTWRRLGGTANPVAKVVSVAVRDSGLYALFLDSGEAANAAAGLSALTLTPRAFSPRGSFAASAVSIAFSLGRPGIVNVTIYNRAGRRVRSLVRSLGLGSGENVVRWDGRDDENAVVSDGLYVVVVESQSDRRQQTLSVVH